MLYGVGATRPPSNHVDKPTGALPGAKSATESLQVSSFIALSELFRELGDVNSSRNMGEVSCLQSENVIAL